MFDNLIFKEEVKLFLKNELRQEKKSGTYLLHGDKGIDLIELAIAFTAGLNCPELEFDFCDVCEVCKKIKSKNYADLEIVGLEQGESKVGIDKIKKTLYKAATSSYEGRKKVFIIKDIESMNIYSANALLKIMEEPPEGTFFILVSNTLNILPTILSRSIVINVKKSTAKELGVTKNVYNFFMGSMKDIINYKGEKVDIVEIKSYESIGEFFGNYLREEKLLNKINLYKSIDDFIYNKKKINKSKKLKIISDILVNLQDEELVLNKSHERKIVEEFMGLFLVRLKSPKDSEKLLSLKQSLKNNVNSQIALTLFFFNF